MRIRLQTQMLTTGYPGKVLHENLSIALEPGKLTALLGPNGAGKSTLIKTISGMLPPLRGEVLIDGSNFYKKSQSERSLLVSMVLTEKIIDTYLRVRDVVALGRYPHIGWLGQLTAEDHHKVQWSLEQCCVEHLADKSIARLSDGERQRVMIARALAQDTPVVILDEPTAHLDVKNRVDLMVLLRELAHEQGKAILVSTHDLSLSVDLADWLWLMPNQREFSSGLPEEIVFSEKFKHSFESPLVSFEPSTGQFLLKPKKNNPVQLAGTGIDWQMTLKALSRLGYRVEPAENAEIEVRQGKWITPAGSFDTLASFLNWAQEALNH
ncbi:MAG TPA: ABC transporter ATP-binding protein [Luteibaculaceae bacterium]|nr:ABC transporter ATP-binding protein [Luteibaculaceae bacterium]